MFNKWPSALLHQADNKLKLSDFLNNFEDHIYSMILRDSANFKNNRICPDGSYGLFLTCR
jgi:hypothetical protein